MQLPLHQWIEKHVCHQINVSHESVGAWLAYRYMEWEVYTARELINIIII